MKVNDTTIPMEEIKSLFERAIIEAYKEKEEINITSKLRIALDELKFYIQEIIETNASETKSKQTLLNSNIVDKLSRLIMRKLFYAKMIIGRIFDNLIEDNTVALLSEDTDVLIKFCNEVLNLQEEVKSTNIAYSLEKKLIKLLNYMKSLKNIDYDQETIIKDLVKNFSNTSVYKEMNIVSSL